MKSVFAYSDYRKFLEDFYRDRKKRGGYSYRHFSEKSKIRSPNFLKLVIAGSKNLTIENTHRFAAACDLRHHEHEFFEALVLYGQASSQEEKNYYRRRILDLKRNHQPHSKAPELKSLLAEWYFPAVMVSLAGASASSDLGKLAAKCGINEKVFSGCLDRLQQLGLVKVTPGGKFQLKYDYSNIEDKKALSVIHKTFLEGQLDLSRRAFRKAYEKKAKFLSHTFTLSKAEFGKIHDKLHSLLDEIDKESELDNGRDVAQLNVQLFMLDEIEG